MSVTKVEVALKSDYKQFSRIFENKELLRIVFENFFGLSVN